MDKRHASDRDVPPGDLDVSTPDIAAGAAHLLDHSRQGESVGPELVRIHIHLILTDETTDARDFCHTGDCAELQSDKPILQGAKLTQIERMTRLSRSRVIQIVFVDPTDARRIRSQFGNNSLGEAEGKCA